MTGAFTYEYPLDIPPGRNGMTPDLKLVQSSQDHDVDDIFGEGWNVTIPYIERYNVDGANLYSTTTPHFYSSLSGELATTTATTTAYVARNDDGSYIRYAFVSNSWIATDKNGITYRFGTSTDGRQDNPSDSSKAYRWMLQEMTDANGNTITYYYSKDGGQVYPSSINYTGSNGTPGIFTIDFSKSLLATSTATSSKTGFPVKTRYKIGQITAKTNGSVVRTYDLAYIAADNRTQPLLSSVTRTGRDEASTTLALPATAFAYSTSTANWQSEGWSLPVTFINSGTDNGVSLADVNGDGLVDIVQWMDNQWGGVSDKHVYLNNGVGWSESTLWDPPCVLIQIPNSHSPSPQDIGTRIVDVNGDLLPDFVCNSEVYLNSGHGWSPLSSVWVNPADILYAGRDGGTRFSDLNGDGLVDIVRSYAYNQNFVTPWYAKEVYMNNGHGWTLDTSWSIPRIFSYYLQQDGGPRLADINADGREDILDYTTVYLNTGTGWATSTDISLPIAVGGQDSILADINNDGLVDLAANSYNYPNIPYDPSWGYNDVYLNTGTGLVLDPAWKLPVPIMVNGQNAGTRVADLDGDGLLDFIAAGSGTNVRPWSNTGDFLNQGIAPNLAVRIREQEGGLISASYKESAASRSGGGAQLNPNLPTNLMTVASIDRFDGISATSTETYTYKNGSFYFADPLDRRVAGFGETWKTDSLGNVTKSYFHQGNATASSTGEYIDDQSKIGKLYRSESYDDHNHLYALDVNRWETASRGGNANFVRLTQATHLDYDGDSDHADRATTYAYDTAIGSPTQQTDWGKVTASNDGSFSDTGSDKLIKDISYASSTGKALLLPSVETVTNQSSARVRQTRNYYDLLGLGSLDKGNLTKQELWKTATSTYIDTEKSYNAYGLVTQEKDPRDKTTTYTYDAYNLYPATTTNALGHVTGKLFDYSSGKTKQVTDPNGRIFQTILDPLDRVTEEKQPDIASPTTLVTKSMYTYDDAGMPRALHKADYLNATDTVDSYIYSDGFGRTRETLTEAEDSGTFVAKIADYDMRGLMHKESLPFIVTGSSYTGTSSPASAPLRISYAYDPIGRVSAITNIIGQTTNTYDDWKTTTTDAEGNVKDYLKDARGNLSQVTEHNGASSYVTNYEYDGNNGLTKITDADGNIRNITYDGLGRRLTAQDLHDTGDGTFGTWTYGYDDSGNLTGQTDPKSQIVNLTYDDLNRVLSEDFTSATGTEMSFGYDTCAEGKGRLCFATSTGAVTGFAYDALGQPVTESKTISGQPFATSYTHDRQGHVTGITYPDGSAVRYAYNTAGKLETIEQKESGGSYAYIITDLDYAPTGQISYKQFGNGVESTYTHAPSSLYRLTNIRTVAPIGEGFRSQGGDELQSGLPEDPEISMRRSLDQEYLPGAEVDLARGHLALADRYADYIDPFIAQLITSEEIDPSIIEETATPEESDVPSESGEATTTTPTEEAPVEAPTEDAAVPAIEELAPEQPQDEMRATTTEEAAFLALPVDSTELRFKASIEKHLGKKVFADGVVKYAYKTDVLVDSMPVGEATEQAARKNGLSLRNEVAEKRTKFARTFATDQPGTFVTEIVSGDPQYYEDDSGVWWLADYGVTTEGSYEYQAAKEEKKSLIDVILSFFLPAKAYASTVDFYPDPDIEANTVDGWTYYQNSGWSATRNSASGDLANDSNPTIVVKDGRGTPLYTKYYFISRAILLFPTVISSVPGQTATILSASLNLYITAANDVFPVYVVASTPGSNTALTNSDYSHVGSVSFGESDGSNTINAYNSIPLNATGLAAIAPGGITKLGIRPPGDYWNSTPGSGSLRTVTFSSAEEAGTSQDPKLVIVYSIPPAGSSGLLAEGATNPSNILDTTPELSAMYYDADSNDAATHYEIQVATSSSFATSSMSWDSGKTAFASTTSATSTPEGVRMPDISYAGSALATSTPYYWRIRFWDTAGLAGLWSTETATFSVAPWNGPSAPSSLLAEGQTNPTNLPVSNPGLTALFNDPDAGDTGSAYEIQVATSSSYWGSPQWESGKVALATSTPQSGRISPVAYAGPTLLPTTTYYWRIKFWDNHDAEGTWSTATSSLSVAIPDPNGVIQDITYSYDRVGNIVQIGDYSGTLAAKTLVFSYDDLNRLMTASTTAASSTPFAESYAYSPIGNLTSKSGLGSYTYAETGYANPQAATSIASTTLTYDNDGNLTGYGSKLYGWDYRNRLSSTGNGTASTTYAYDETSQRVLKVGSSTTTYYPNKYFDKTGTSVARHIFDDQGNLIVTIEGNGTATTTSYVHADHLGGTNDVTDSDAAVTETTDYYPYGAQRLDIGSHDEKRKYIGQQYDSESSLSYLNARYYDGARGQFLSQDPVFWEVGQTDDGNAALTNPQAMNSYGYSGNNPITNKDPNGRFWNLIMSLATAVFLPNHAGETVNNDGTVTQPDSMSTGQYVTTVGGVAVGGAVIDIGVGAVTAKVASHLIPEGRAAHMFVDKAGHVVDTPANRKMLTNVANDTKTNLGIDSHGVTWSAKINKDGTQTWVQTRNGEIINGGVNQTPKSWDPKTGLSSPSKPASKSK